MNADWNAEAMKVAKRYHNYTSFSRSGLVQQLEHDGFSTAKAQFGVHAAGL